MRVHHRIDGAGPPLVLWLDVAGAAAIAWVPRGKIRRLLNGTENRFGRRAAPAPRP